VVASLEQDMLGLNVAMNDAPLMRILHGIAELEEKWKRLLDGQRPAVLLEQIMERPLAEQWRHQIAGALLIAKFNER
jgi:hypothetical protein